MLRTGISVNLNRPIQGTVWSVKSVILIAKHPDLRCSGKVLLCKDTDPIPEIHDWSASKTSEAPWVIYGDGAKMPDGRNSHAAVSFPFSLLNLVNNGVKQILSEWLDRNSEKFAEPTPEEAAVETRALESFRLSCQLAERASRRSNEAPVSSLPTPTFEPSPELPEPKPLSVVIESAPSQEPAVNGHNGYKHPVVHRRVKRKRLKIRLDRMGFVKLTKAISDVQRLLDIRIRREVLKAHRLDIEEEIKELSRQSRDPALRKSEALVKRRLKG